MNKMPSGMKKHRSQMYQNRKLPDSQNVFLSSSSHSSSSDGLVQNCVTLSQLFSHKIAACYTEQCTSSLLFYNFKVWWGASVWSLKTYGFICNAIFFTCAHVHKALSNETQLLLKIAKLEMWSLCGELQRDRERLGHPHVDLMFDQMPGQWSFSQSAYIY